MSNDTDVKLVSAKKQWPKLFITEKSRIQGLLVDAIIEHIGSTSVAGLPAKPTIDILVGISTSGGLKAAAGLLVDTGYIQEGERDGHIWLCYPQTQDRQYIIHLVIVNNSEWLRRLAFRDFLRSHPEHAAQYGQLKQSLAKAHAHDLDSYTKGKSDFVRRTVEMHLSGLVES